MQVGLVIAVALGLAPAEGKPDAAEDPLKAPFAAGATQAAPARSSGTGTTVEQCDGSRTRADAASRSCRRWTIEWSQAGKVWGISSGPSRAAVVAERERLLGFARQYSRWFDRPLDRRWASPSEPICDACKANPGQDQSGLFGDGQRFGGLPTQRAVAEAKSQLAGLAIGLFRDHTPRLQSVARLSRSRGTAKAARRYAAHLDAAVRDVVRSELVLDNSVLLRSPKAASRTSSSLQARTRALAKSFGVLKAAVAREVKKAHGGVYFDDAHPGPSKPTLRFDVSAAKATLTYVDGDFTAVWFEGAVGLDGSIKGHTLVAPAGKTMKCTAITTECGYIQAPAVVRFSHRKEGDKHKRRVVEMWFRQADWVRAKLFSR